MVLPILDTQPSVYLTVRNAFLRKHCQLLNRSGASGYLIAIGVVICFVSVGLQNECSVRVQGALIFSFLVGFVLATTGTICGFVYWFGGEMEKDTKERAKRARQPWESDQIDS